MPVRDIGHGAVSLSVAGSKGGEQAGRKESPGQ